MELTITTTVAVMKNPDEITDDIMKNFEKNPANGGIPAMENSVKDSVHIKVTFFTPFAVQLTK